MPNIIFSVMQKPFIKCVIRQRVGRFLHSRKKLIRRFQKKRQYTKEFLDYKKRAIFAINCYGFSNTPSGAPDLKNKSIGISDFLQTNAI